MSIVPRLKASPGVLVRTLVSLGAVLAVVAAVAAYAGGQAVLGAGLGSEFVMLVAIGALSRRYGVALPGNGFSSYIVASRRSPCSTAAGRARPLSPRRPWSRATCCRGGCRPARRWA